MIMQGMQSLWKFELKVSDSKLDVWILPFQCLKKKKKKRFIKSQFRKWNKIIFSFYSQNFVGNIFSLVSTVCGKLIIIKEYVFNDRWTKILRSEIWYQNRLCSSHDYQELVGSSNLKRKEQVDVY